MSGTSAAGIGIKDEKETEEEDAEEEKQEEDELEPWNELVQRVTKMALTEMTTVGVGELGKREWRGMERKRRGMVR